MKLIINLSETIHVFGDERNYILIIRKDAKQAMRNGFTMYFQSLEAMFQELFTYQLKYNLADGLNKSAADMLKIITDTRKYIMDVIAPYDELRPAVK